MSALRTRQRLRSSSSTALVISRTSRATIGVRAFSAAATTVWNSLPEAAHSSPSLTLFRKSLKKELFTRSYTTRDARFLFHDLDVFGLYVTLLKIRLLTN